MIVRALPWVMMGLGLVIHSLTSVHVTAAERRTEGRDIYRKQCAQCHGRSGQGVKGKYEDALYGDWSLDKLSRYIDRNMPENDPEKCVGADAQKVAQYIYDAFYSREARARQNPPRIELVRLTNRQYVQTIADLLKSFTGPDASIVSPERGLQGSYYKSRGFNQDKFGTGSPFTPGTADAEGVETNGFAIQWRGSIMAEESGDYEFIVKTPNGFRLWINADQDEPTIDGWVASGSASDHRATLRLIGGRAYPLRLDVFKFKDKTASIALLWKPPHGAEQIIPARCLLPARTTPTFVVRTPFPPDDSSVGYERGVGVSKAWDEATTQAAIETANHILQELDRLTGSKPGDSDRLAKLETFCTQFVTAAFRRPLTPEQKRIYVLSHLKSDAKPEEAVKRIVLLALKSPRFLYLGLKTREPDSFEVAARLSYGLWDSLPDRELWQAAEQNALQTQEQVMTQARRMLGDPRARAKVLVFLQHWLQMNQVEDLAKDTQLFPGFTPEIISDLRASLNLFLEDTFWDASSDYRRLLLAEELFLNNRLAQFYGVSTNPSGDFAKVRLSANERSGVITHPYLLAAFSYNKTTSPIHRGVFLTRNIVGRSLKPPPMAVAFKDSDFDPQLTMREKVAELTRPQACQSCHSVINPLGFSLEHYDAVGRFRTVENGKPIDAASEYLTDDGQKVRLTGARDVARFALGSEHAQNAFIEQLFNQVVKQLMLAYGREVMGRLRQSFVASEYNMQRLLLEIATISALQGVEPSAESKKKT
jgi:antitoxin component HigA of HigAB toxin-antitoxin module